MCVCIYIHAHTHVSVGRVHIPCPCAWLLTCPRSRYAKHGYTYTHTHTHIIINISPKTIYPRIRILLHVQKGVLWLKKSHANIPSLSWYYLAEGCHGTSTHVNADLHIIHTHSQLTYEYAQGKPWFDNSKWEVTHQTPCNTQIHARLRLCHYGNSARMAACTKSQSFRNIE